MEATARRSSVTAFVSATFVTVGVLSVVLFGFGHDPLSFGFPVLGYYPWAFASGEPTYSPERMRLWSYFLMPIYIIIGIFAARLRSGWLAAIFLIIPILSALLFWMRFHVFMHQMS